MVVINFTVWKLASVRYVKSEKKKKEDKRSTWLWREGEGYKGEVGVEGDSEVSRDMMFISANQVVTSLKEDA